MSAKTETLVVPAKPVATYIVAVLVALVFGASLGSLITNAVISDANPAAETALGIRPWDEQMLEQMQGRQLAATYRADGPGIQPWDEQKLEAMALRALAAARS
jgi:hypothetical protein